MYTMQRSHAHMVVKIPVHQLVTNTASHTLVAKYIVILIYSCTFIPMWGRVRNRDPFANQVSNTDPQNEMTHLN